jgi:hypothetical protein
LLNGPKISQVVVIGDKRKFLSALVNLPHDQKDTKKWHEYVKNTIDKYNENPISSAQKIQKYKLINGDFTVENDETEEIFTNKNYYICLKYNMNSSHYGGKSKSSKSKKGGNFLGDVGELVAPTGWESFATTAGLFALDRADAALRRGKSEKSSAVKKGGSTKTSSKSKKGGNFLGSVSELFVPTGWENFATAASLLAIDRADAAFRRSRNSNKKQKGGADLDGHESIETMDSMLDQIQSEGDFSSPNQMNGGGAKKGAKKGGKSKKTSSLQTSSSTTRSKSKAKGGNFLGAVGDLVAPTGWGPFATAAGLLALDRADAAFRRGTKEKKEKMKGGKKMKGGLCEYEYKHGIVKEKQYNGGIKEVYEYRICCKDNKDNCMRQSYPSRQEKSEESIKENLLTGFKRVYGNNNKN